MYIESEAWGREGHFITTRIAHSLLTEYGQNLITNLLADGVNPIDQVICEASVWADHVSDSRQYRWSKNLHYINIPDGLCDGFRYDRECSSNCTVSAIVKFAQIVETVTYPRSERIDSLRFLIHLIADLYQPLHVSFARDKGGSLLKVVPPTTLKRDRHGNPVANISLHSAWDTDIIQYMMQKGKIDWKQLADKMINSTSDAAISGMPDDELPFLVSVANNSANITCSAGYVHETGLWINTGDHISTDYYDRAASIVYDQLTQAGLHIARVINSIGHTLYAEDESMSDDSGYDSSTEA